MKLPEGYQTVMPYLILNNAEGFLDFTRKVFNATLKEKHLSDDGKIMHAEVVIGGSVIMIGNAGDRWNAQPAGLFIYVEYADDTFATAVAEGATIVMELSDQSYGRTGGIMDPHGNTWWITSVK